MTVRTGICVVVMAASIAMAQDSPMGTINQMRRTVKGIGNATEQRRENAAKQLGLTPGAAPASTNAAKPQATQSQKQKGGAAKNAMRTQPVKSTKAVPVVAKEAAASPEGGAAAEESSEKPKTLNFPRSQRDPFQTVIRNEPVGLGCASGKKCLVVGKIMLKGIVRSQAGMIAVVENEQKKSYFLHENDPVFNGHVVKISADSVVFQEKVVDKLGHSSMRDVVKRLSAVPVA